MSRKVGKIYLKDLLMVLLYGFVFSIIGGVIGGLLDYVFYTYLDLEILFGIFIETFFVGIFIRRAYNNYSFLYPILAIVFVYLSFLCASAVELFMALKDTFENPLKWTFEMTFGNSSFYISIFKQPIDIIISVSKGYLDTSNLAVPIINILATIVSFILVFYYAKGRN